jgi:hypothetical protein
MSDIGPLARAIVEWKRRGELSAEALFDLEMAEEKEQRMRNITAAAQRAAEAASTNKEHGNG